MTLKPTGSFISHGLFDTRLAAAMTTWPLTGTVRAGPCSRFFKEAAGTARVGCLNPMSAGQGPNGVSRGNSVQRLSEFFKKVGAVRIMGWLVMATDDGGQPINGHCRYSAHHRRIAARGFGTLLNT